MDLLNRGCKVSFWKNPFILRACEKSTNHYGTRFVKFLRVFVTKKVHFLWIREILFEITTECLPKSYSLNLKLLNFATFWIREEPNFLVSLFYRASLLLWKPPNTKSQDSRLSFPGTRSEITQQGLGTAMRDMDVWGGIVNAKVAPMELLHFSFDQ